MLMEDYVLQAPALKYQLPTEPNVYVDLVDDEDTQLMFDEWHDFSTAQNKSASAKLHLFVDWLRRGTTDQKHRRFGDSVASLEQGKEPGSQSAGEGHVNHVQQLILWTNLISGFC